MTSLVKPEERTENYLHALRVASPTMAEHFKSTLASQSARIVELEAELRTALETGLASEAHCQDLRGRLTGAEGRIAELEANVTHWKTHAKMMAKVADNHKAHEKTLEAERDAVRKALAWFVSPVTMMNGEVHFASITVRCRIPIPWTGEEKESSLLQLHEAALLAAAREGGAK